MLQQLFALVHQAHATPTATGAGFDHQREADAFGFLLQGGVVLGTALVAGDAGHAGVEHGEFGQAFAAHQFDRLDTGADEGERGLLAGAGEVGVFREEAVAGVNGIGAGQLGGGEDGLCVQVGLVYGRRADVYGFVGHLHVQGIGIRVAVDGHGAVAQGPGQCAGCGRRFRRGWRSGSC